MIRLQLNAVERSATALTVHTAILALKNLHNWSIIAVCS